MWSLLMVKSIHLWESLILVGTEIIKALKQAAEIMTKMKHT